VEPGLGEQLADELTDAVDGVKIDAVKHSYIGLGFFVGAWAGGVLAAVVLIAIDVAYSNELTTGFGSSLPSGAHVTSNVVILAVVLAAVAGGAIGTAIGARFTPHGR
jgi:uncharacterized membrane protein YoaK (UPF0700 family)